MSNNELINDADNLFKRLFPICRSLTGNGVRETLRIIKEICDFEIKEVPSGTEVFDWKIPDEWNVEDVYILDDKNNKIIDFKNNNIHLVNYSIPIDKKMSFSELRKHLHTLSDMPDAIPYRTTYYKRDWGFCLTQKQFDELDKDVEYHVVIKSTLEPGNLTYGESIKTGGSGQEFLFSTYCCHPSLANDNLSGVVLWTLLNRYIQSIKTRHSYRFVIIPETIGSITYLSENKDNVNKITGGFILTSAAGPGKQGYKPTFKKDDLIDQIVLQTFKEKEIDFIHHPFDVMGSDERQYSSAGFKIPMGTVTKDKYYDYDYYHTSLDNLDFVSAKNLIVTFEIYVRIIENFENNLIYNSLNPCCSPQLGKRNLYPNIGGTQKQKAFDTKVEHHDRMYDIEDDKILGGDIDAMEWLMFFIDGKISLLEIAKKSGLSIRHLYRVAEILKKNELLKR